MLNTARKRAGSVICLLFLFPLEALGCSCLGTQSIEEAIENAEVVVLGRVLERLAPDFAFVGLKSDPIVVEVERSLKGSVQDRVRITADAMCYRTFSLEDFEVGRTYLFPMDSFALASSGGAYEPRDFSPFDASVVTTTDLYVLPSCSESALALEGGQLYGNPNVSGHFMSLARLEQFMSLGLLGSWRLVLYGGSTLVLFAVILLLLKLRDRRRVAWRH